MLLHPYLCIQEIPQLILEGDAHEFVNQEAEVSHHFSRRARESAQTTYSLAVGVCFHVVAHPVSGLGE